MKPLVTVADVFSQLIGNPYPDTGRHAATIRLEQSRRRHMATRTIIAGKATKMDHSRTVNIADADFFSKYSEASVLWRTLRPRIS